MPGLSPNETRLKTEVLIATGLTSEVFSWGPERVLKLFFPWVQRETVEREFSATQAIHRAGMPTPAAFELLQVGQRSGIVFERLHGDSLLRGVERRPWTLFTAARQLAEQHARVHSYDALPELSTQREQIERWIASAEDFPPAQKAAARAQMARLPTGGALCHGDFHPGNIILTSRGPMIIDWAGASRGHPLGDVARTSVLFESANLPPNTPLKIRILMKLARQLLHRTYLRRYLEVRPGTLEDIESWRVVQRLAGLAWRAGKNAALAKLQLQPDQTPSN